MPKNTPETEAQHPAPSPARTPLASDELIRGRTPEQLGTHGGPAHAGAKAPPEKAKSERKDESDK